MGAHTVIQINLVQVAGDALAKDVNVKQELGYKLERLLARIQCTRSGLKPSPRQEEYFTCLFLTERDLPFQKLIWKSRSIKEFF